MIHSSVTPSEVVEFLNQLAIIDSSALKSLIASRVDCNQELANHLTVQVARVGAHGFKIGLLGVLNGLFGTYPDGFGCIAAWYDENENLVKFSLLSEEDHQLCQE